MDVGTISLVLLVGLIGLLAIGMPLGLASAIACRAPGRAALSRGGPQAPSRTGRISSDAKLERKTPSRVEKSSVDAS